MATESITEGWLKRNVPGGAGGTARDPEANARPRRVFDSALPGFGVVIGARFATFIARGRVEQDGETIRRDVSIGRWQHVGAGEDMSERWTEPKARKRAQLLLGQIGAGQDPVAKDDSTASGPTLADGLKIHLGNMRKGGGKGRLPNGEEMPCSERSIRNVQDEVTNHLEAWLDRPIAELTALELTKVVDGIRAKTEVRAGSVNPPGAALAKRLMRHVSAIWESTDELHDLAGKNPARKVRTQGLAPKEARIEPGEFKSWLAKVEELAPVRRDFNKLALHTSIRSEGLRHMTWDDVDFGERVIHVRRAKGNRPYSIPMTASVEKILRARQKDNKREFEAFGGDHGYVLPTLTRSKPFEIIPLAAPKEYDVDDNGNRETSMPGPHILRKTWNSVAIEARIPSEDREALMNHEGRGVNAKHYGFPRNWDALRASARIVEKRLLECLAGRASKKKRSPK
jgi:integrase